MIFLILFDENCDVYQVKIIDACKEYEWLKNDSVLNVVKYL